MKIEYRKTVEVEVPDDDLRLLVRYAQGKVSRSQVQAIIDEYFDEGNGNDTYIPGYWLETLAPDLGISTDTSCLDVNIY